MLDIATSNSIVAENVNHIIKERNLKQSAIAQKVVLHRKSSMQC